MRLTALVTVLLPLPALIAGCAATSPPLPTPLPAPAADTCSARAYAALVGQPATALERQLIMRPVRLVRGSAGAMRPDRLTFHIATPPGTPADTPPRIAERITAVTCG